MRWSHLLIPPTVNNHEAPLISIQHKLLNDQKNSFKGLFQGGLANCGFVHDQPEKSSFRSSSMEVELMELMETGVSIF